MVVFAIHWHESAMGLLCFVYLFGVLFIFYISHISEIIQYLSFSIWLISLSIIPSRPIHIITNGKTSSFYAWVVFHFVCVCVYILPYPFTIDGHLGYFFILAIVNNTVVNIGVHISFWNSVFILFKKIPKNGIARFSGSSINCFEETPYCFPQWLHQFTF